MQNAGLKILILDDLADMQEWLCTLLENDGHAPEAVGTAAALLERMQSARYDVIILDVHLGNEETIAQVRSRIHSLFPGVIYDDEAGVELHGYFFRGEPVTEETYVSGAYLVPAIRAIDDRVHVVVLTDRHIDEDVAALLKKQGYDNIPKMLDTQQQTYKELAIDVIGSIRGISPRGHEPQETPSAPPEAPTRQSPSRPRALPRFSGLESMIRSSSNSLREILKAHLERWEGYHVRGEVLYLNRTQRLLERIEHIGFDDTEPGLFVRYVEDVEDENFAGKGICSYAASRCESVLVPNVKFDLRYMRLRKNDSTLSELVIPLKTEDDFVGILNLEADEVGAFDNHHLEYFEKIAPVLALLIRYEAFEHEERILKASLEAIVSGSDDSLILQKILDGMIELAGGDALGCILVGFDSDTGEPMQRVIANRGLEKIEVGQTLRLNDLGVIKLALQEGKDMYWTERDRDMPFFSLTSHAVRSEYVKLLKVGGKIIAILNIESERVAISERHRRAIDRLILYAAAFQSGLQETRRKQTEFARTFYRSTFHTLNRRLEVFEANLSRFKADPTLRERLRFIREQCGTFERYSDVVLEDRKVLKFSSLLEEAMKFASTLDVKLHVTACPENSGVYASDVGIEFILQNLLMNTQEHAGSDSKRANIEITLGLPSERWTLSYWDNGQAPEHAERLFDSRHEGKGIGIIKDMCRLMGWEYSSKRHASGGLLVEFRFWPVSSGDNEFFGGISQG